MTKVTPITLLKQVQPGLLWYPAEGRFTTNFLRQKSSEADGPTYKDLTEGKESVLHIAQRILGRCHPPSEPASKRTGLVVGYVQSGKTMSFETVIALARDNGYGLVILLAGTKNILLDQSEDRLIKDLGIDDGDGGWSHQANPTTAQKSEIESKLSSWRSKNKRAVLVTVLKHVKHLNNLAQLLNKLTLTEIPALIIDDESDQAGLNTRAEAVRKNKAGNNNASQTYAAILALRSALPHHSYLQYTATPQANLLLAQTDLLNPEFAELVHPGTAYTGGKAFFQTSKALIKVIPPTQVPTVQNDLKTAPKSLLEAFRTFLLVAAHHSISRINQPRGRDRNRTMMVHPAVLTSSHTAYKTWLETAQKSLFGTVKRMLETDSKSAQAIFQSEFNSLKTTFPDIKPLSDLVVAMEDDVFDDFKIVEINGTKQAEKKVKWKDTKYWVIVGAAKLDRGYTVEGLCVTYMPRPLGTSAAADNLQQRARFFGYKKDYLGLCRVYLQNDVKVAFEEYVEHEEFIRDALKIHQGKPLSDWRRDFILDELLKPTRPNVIGLNIRRIPADGWMWPGALHTNSSAVTENRVLVDSVLGLWRQQFGPLRDSSNLDHFRRNGLKSNVQVIENVPLKSLISDLLLHFKVKDHRDAEEHSAALIAMGTALALNPSLLVDIYLMNKTYRSRENGRGFLAQDVRAPIKQYFSNSAGTANDKDHMTPRRVSLQLRRLDVGSHVGDGSKADVRDVPWFALHIPKELRKSLQVELRG